MSGAAQLLTDRSRRRQVLVVLSVGLAILLIGVTPAKAQHSPALDSLLRSLDDEPHHDLKGVVVELNGQRIAERYFNGDDSTTLHDIRSATKSITSTLAGIAIRQHLIAGVTESLTALLPVPPPSALRAARLSDLLTMRSGLDSEDRDTTSAGNESRLDASDDWLAFAFGVPGKWPPGQHYAYSSLTAFLAGAVVEQAARMSLTDYARQTLFDPLGITRFEWRRGPHGVGVGQGNLSLTTQDLARIGELFRNWGRFEGRQVIDSGWVADALTPTVTISSVDRYADGYGYMWYSKRYEIGGRSLLVQFASGNGGNKIYIVPELDLIIAITSSAYNRPWGQPRSEQILQQILTLIHTRE